MKIDTQISKKPLIFKIISEYAEIAFTCFNPVVKSPAITRIIPCPNENKNSINIASNKLLPIAVNAIMPAKIGVEQGVPARAKSIPIKIGYKNNELLLFIGKVFTKVGNSKSKTPNSFNPITISKDAMINVKYIPNIGAKTLPVKAHITPIIVNTIAVPRIKEDSWINVRFGVFLEYPPTYPIINGSIAKEHGEIDATTPPKKDIKSIATLKLCGFCSAVEKLIITYFLYVIF